MEWQETGRVLVVGLGNPGSRYDATRHNLGFLLADALGHAAGVSLSRQKFRAQFGTGSFVSRNLVIIKPMTYMNLSGQAVSSFMSFYDHEPAQTILCHDDIDLEFGDVRVKVGGGHGGHKGLRSIFENCGSREFVRVRLGVGRPGVGDVSSHVLGKFTNSDMAELDEVISRGLEGLRLLFAEGPKAAMNTVNGLYRALSSERVVGGAE